jgi:glycerol-3-phosphate dehydrogenase (NAD(P)+)
MTVPTAVIGAGAWGTALAWLLAGKEGPTRLWAYEADVADQINHERENSRYLPGVVLPRTLKASASLPEVLDGAGALIIAVPSHVAAGVIAQIAPHLPSGIPIVSATKGLEEKRGRSISTLLEELLPVPAGSVFALSGPSFAIEVCRGLPTAVVLAGGGATEASLLQRLLMTPAFRIYLGVDRLGVELGGALKNVIAVAAGIADGLGFGHNTRAALITRGLAEMVRLGRAMGADPRTFAGLSGMGDLVLTCTGALSRNRAVGFQLAEGKTLAAIVAGSHSVAEGVHTARVALMLAERHHVEMPIVRAVCAVLFEGKEPVRAVSELMERAARHELDQA